MIKDIKKYDIFFKKVFDMEFEGCFKLLNIFDVCGSNIGVGLDIIVVLLSFVFFYLFFNFDKLEKLC